MDIVKDQNCNKNVDFSQFHTMLYICIILILSVSHNLLENVKSSRNVAIDMSDESIGDLVFHLQPEQKRVVREVSHDQSEDICVNLLERRSGL